MVAFSIRKSAPFAALLATMGCGETFVASGGNGGDGGQGGTSATTTSDTTMSTGEGGGTATMTATGPLCEPLGADGCNTCLADQCEEVYCECANVPHCLGFADCMKGGADFLEYCSTKFPKGISLFGRLQVCANEKCSKACPFEEVPECSKCQYQECGVQFDACFGSPVCWLFLNCIQECAPDTSCFSPCTLEEAPGWKIFQPLNDCTKDACASECAP